MKHFLIPIAVLALATPQAVIAADDLTVTPDQVVYDLPAGAEAKNYLREGELFRQWGSDAIKNEALSASLFSIAETQDGKVYIANALSNAIYSDTKGYLVGTRTDNTVTFTFPQALQIGDNYLAVMRLEETTIEYESEWDPGTIRTRPSYKIYEGTQEITFTIEDGKFIQTPDEYFGLVKADGEWNGYGEYNLSFIPFNAELVTVPEDAEAFNIGFKYESDLYVDGNPAIYSLISGRKKGNDIYFQGASNIFPESWVKGTINGDKITFEGGQLMGVGQYGIEYFCTGFDAPVFIPGYNVWEHHYTLTPSLEMAYDATNGVVSAFDKNDCFIFNSSTTAYAYGSVFLNPSLLPQPEEVDLKPIMPVFNPGVNVWMNGEEPILTFQVLPLNIYGQVLDKANLSIEILQEGVPYVFTVDDYWFLTEDMPELPWGYNNGDIIMLANGFTTILFEHPYLIDVAMRTVYRVGDQVYYSDLQSPEDPKVQNPLDPGTMVHEIKADPRFEDGNADVYTINGMLVKKNADRDFISGLPKGIYILNIAGNTYKIAK